MVHSAEKEYVCNRCGKSWAIEPESGYPGEQDFVASGGDPKDLHINDKHVGCPFCGSKYVTPCD